MSIEANLVSERSGGDADFLARLAQQSDRILVKKLANNDRDWARCPDKHQNGVYIPHEQRDCGFFPLLEAKELTGKDAHEIRECFFMTVWPQRDSEVRRSRLVHYTSKRQETHLTRLPKLAFAELLPASWLVMGRTGTENEYSYQCLTIDSGSDEASLLQELFDLQVDFLVGVFDPSSIRKTERERVLDFAERVVAAWLEGKISNFASENAVMPRTVDLAQMARETYLKKYDIDKIDPFALEAPGDALREISRIIEWNLFKDFQRRERSVAMVRIILGDDPRSILAKDVIRQLLDRYAEIDALMLAAGQQRKSRAGYSYEHHIEAMLTDGNIPFEKQVIIEAKKRPDFILPSLAFVDSGNDAADTGLILSAKTTLRERWKQVEREMGNRRLFLTTVDENIASTTIKDMHSIGVRLIIPESLMYSKETEYAGHENVMSFSEFCTIHVKPNLLTWKT